MKKILGLGLILILVLSIMVGCGTSQSSEASSTAEQSQTSEETASQRNTETSAGDTSLVFSLITMDSVNEYWLTMKAGAEAKAAELGVKLTFDSPVGTTDAQAQYNMVENAISNSVNAIMLAAVDADALASAVDKANEAGIPVIYVDAAASSENNLASFSTDNAAAGAIAADELAKRINETGEVAIINAQQGVATCQKREQGFIEEMGKKYPNITIVDTLYSDGDTQKAMEQTQNLLSAHPDIVGIFAANESNTIGVAQGLTQLQKVGDVIVVGFDPSDTVKELIKDGSVACAMQQNPDVMGSEAVQTAYNYIVNGKTPEPKDVDTGVTVVTKDNLE